MAHRLNTNKQFMVGNGILAFAVIFVVVIFVYMSLRLDKKKDEDRNFIETYTITLTKGFVGDSLSLMINDSVLVNKKITEEPEIPIFQGFPVLLFYFPICLRRISTKHKICTDKVMIQVIGYDRYTVVTV